MGVGCYVRVPACEEPATWTKPQGATGVVPGVNGVGPLQGTHTPHSCQGAEILCPFRAISKMHQAKFYCITRCVALKRTRATFPCAAPRHNSSHSRCAARADLAEISRRTRGRAVIF